MPESTRPELNVDYYIENGLYVYTVHYLKKRKFCCGNGCRHCPYSPKHKRGSRNMQSR